MELAVVHVGRFGMTHDSGVTPAGEMRGLFPEILLTLE